MRLQYYIRFFCLKRNDLTVTRQKLSISSVWMIGMLVFDNVLYISNTLQAKLAKKKRIINALCLWMCEGIVEVTVARWNFFCPTNN